MLGLLAGFIIGFWVANNLFYVRNTGAPTANPTAAAPGTNPSTPAENDPQQLSQAEIKRVVAQADAKPTDLAFQKEMGVALYRYASAQQDTSLLPDVRRLLERASAGSPNDVDLLVAMGNVNFDIAQSSDPAGFKTARDYYNQALAIRPNDPNVRTDLGLTYFFDRPSDPTRAIAEYRKSLQIDPKHELTLQNLSFALIATGAYDEATTVMATLESVNPSNNALPNMRAQLAQKRNASN